MSAEPGCITAAQQREAQSDAVTINAFRRFKSCVLKVWEKQEYSSLLPHIPDPESGRLTAAQLRDGSRPSRTEAKLLAAAYNDAAPCRSQILESLQTVRPDIVPVLVNTFTKARSATALLNLRRITWGEAARRGHRQLLDLQRAVAAADQRWVAELNASHQAEIRERRVAAMAMRQFSSSQPAINSINRVDWVP